MFITRGIGDVLKAYAITNAQLSASPVSSSTETFGFPGSVPSISANGNQNAIAWALQADAFDAGGPGVLHAYNATNLAESLYDSSQAGDRDQMGLAQKFTVPTIANGRVYAGTGGGLLVYGHWGAPAFVVQPQNQVVLAGGRVVLGAMADGTLPIDYQWQFGGTNLPNATNLFLEVGPVTPAQVGLYTVNATNPEGVATSATAALGSVQLQINETQASLAVGGPSGSQLRVDYRTDLKSDTNWVLLTHVVLSTGPVQVVDPGSTQAAQRFYRTTLLGPGPTNAP